MNKKAKVHKPEGAGWDVKVTKRYPDGSKDIDINCSHCGKPISKTSVDFGMDCENDCARKAFEKMELTPEMEGMREFLGMIRPGGPLSSHKGGSSE